jgi:hypothetical protein
MVTALKLLREPKIQWLTASPLWPRLQDEGISFQSPAILRFTTDTFMDDFLAIASNTPERLVEWRVQKETWRKPAPTPALSLTAPGAQPLSVLDTSDPDLADRPLKLYQAAHQRYYLVTANLVCRIPGLPDKALDPTKNEQVSFVLRRDMRDELDGQIKEHALVNGAWQPVGVPLDRLLPGEQQFPMFPVTYPERTIRSRRMFAGLVPVSGREAFMTARRQPPGGGSDGSVLTEEDRKAQLLTVLNMDVLAPWGTIIESRDREFRVLGETFDDIDGDAQDEVDVIEGVEKARDTLQTASWYALLDLAYYLDTHLNDVWDYINSTPNISPPAGTPGRALIEALQGATFDPETSNKFDKDILQNKLQGRSGTAGATMTQALKDAYAARNFLEGTTAEYSELDADPGWPSSKFLLCGRNVAGVLDTLESLVSAALDELPPDATRRVPLIPASKDITETTHETDYANDRFAIRCVFQRPNCPPSIHPTVVSARSEGFTMASFFDPDAPARAIRIPMPVDTSPAGLRKFSKNTMFVISDTLGCQLEKVKGLGFGDLVRSVLPWPFHKSLDTSAASCPDGKLDMGMLCTLSIPIITICALILLIMIVIILDIIFKWVPYLLFCLPIPGLKAKEET